MTVAEAPLHLPCQLRGAVTLGMHRWPQIPYDTHPNSHGERRSRRPDHQVAPVPTAPNPRAAPRPSW